MIASFMQDWKMKANPLPKVEEDGQRDKQGGDGQSVADNCHVEQDVSGLQDKDKNLRKLQKRNVDMLTCKQKVIINESKINKLYLWTLKKEHASFHATVLICFT